MPGPKRPRRAEPRLFETRYPSPQPFLWDVGDVGWHTVQRLRSYRPRRAPSRMGMQERLPL